MKNIRKFRKWQVFLFILLMTLMLGSIVTPAADKKKSKYARKSYTGWELSGDKQYFRKKGKRVYGWRLINGKYYYITKKRGVWKNRIAGDRPGRYFYVDANGARVTDPQIMQAVSLIKSCSKGSQGARMRLYMCFRRLCTYDYSWFPDYPSAYAMPGYADHTFRVKIANCWRYGAAMAYCARCLGYDSKVTIGGVTAYQYRNLSPHGWCEVLIDGEWYMIDVSMQRHHPDANLFLVKRSEYPYRLRCDNDYYLTVPYGRAVWM